MLAETTKPRLIDANAFSNALNRRYGEAIEKKSFEEAKGIEIAIRMLSIATTVETTDEVLARMNERTGEVILENSFQESEWIVRYYPTIKESCEGLDSPENGFGKTPLEAVKRLEELLNRK